MSTHATSTPDPYEPEDPSVLAAVEAVFDDPDERAPRAPRGARRRQAPADAPPDAARPDPIVVDTATPAATPAVVDPRTPGQRTTVVTFPGARTAPEPRPTVLARRYGARVFFGSTGLSVGVVAVAVTGFLLLGMVFPWLSPFGDDDSDSITSSDKPVEQVRTVSDPGPTPAETAVDQVMATDLPVFADGDWEETKPTDSISAPSLGFGCDPKDGLSPAAASTRAWVTGDGSSSVTVSARAYSAGAGPVAVDGMEAASLACEAAWVDYPSLSLGAETTQISSTRVSALVWRRGDVLMVAQVTSNRHAGDPSAYTDALTRLDDSLDSAIAETCIDQDATADDATRSPYVDRAAYSGYHVTETVKRPKSKKKTAEQRVANDPKIKPVANPAPAVDLPDLGDLPVAPSPAPTDGPLTLPAAVTLPTVPPGPTRPATTSEVQRATEDLTGPGCGWAFTAQAPPEFDARSAAADFDADVTTTERALNRDWNRWQDSKVAFFGAYADYLKDARKYRRYVGEVAVVRDAWQVIEDARAEYYTAHADWETAVAARDEWLIERAAAKQAYQEAKQVCRDQADDSDPDQDPTSPTSPTSPPIPGTPGPSPSPSTGPSAGPGEDEGEEPLVCPPVRPDILSETAPEVSDEPVPSPAAQLPA